jgi:poly(3-hydroxybutyrate) depolymerase
MKLRGMFGLALWLAAAPAFAEELVIQPGEGSFIFTDQKGNPDKPVTTWYFRPEVWDASRPVLFVMHGMLRNGQTYRRAWIEPARQHNALLLVPEFANQYYSSAAYNRGGVSLDVDESKWTFALIENLFDHVRGATGLTRTNYLLYGHSAGGQFVHRFVEFMPHARFERAVAANPGYYTMPRFDRDYPYGFGKSPMDDERLRRGFSRPLTILLGENDTDPNDKNLHRAALAMEQGQHRFERGDNFIAMARELAAERNLPLNWTLQIVPGVGHSNAGMMPAATKILFAP